MMGIEKALLANATNYSILRYGIPPMKKLGQIKISDCLKEVRAWWAQLHHDIHVPLLSIIEIVCGTEPSSDQGLRKKAALAMNDN